MADQKFANIVWELIVIIYQFCNLQQIFNIHKAPKLEIFAHFSLKHNTKIKSDSKKKLLTCHQARDGTGIVVSRVLCFELTKTNGQCPMTRCIETQFLITFSKKVLSETTVLKKCSPTTSLCFCPFWGKNCHGRLKMEKK